MTTIEQVAENVHELMHCITKRGPTEPAFDGLRAFQHRSRMENFLTGATTKVVPLTIDLWPSIKCNAHCCLCQYRLSGARMKAEQSGNAQGLSTEQANEILLGAASAGVKSIIFTGGGEPLMNDNIVKIVRQARKLGLRWGLVTNGILLSPQIVQALIAETPAFLRVSVDAGSAERYAQIYGVKETTFHTVVSNVLNASKIAQRLKCTAMGISFTLDYNTDVHDLADIRRLLRYFQNKCAGGLRFVAFRPRLLQYRNWIAVCPQPGAERFQGMAQAIRENIVKPLRSIISYDTKLDVKDGLFILAGRKKLPICCLSGAWITTISHQGTGYITGELAGANRGHQDWGQIIRASDFEKMWFGEIRIKLNNDLENGKIQMPVVHRTTPIDEFLQMVRGIIKVPLELRAARELLGIIAKQNWYRSSNSEFI